ncbi:MAG: hypothetical protein IPK79_08700 [Vampirovibrionales bacterium]|nr:hypothetical protein [Vampirovibrionales bacterium]
MKVKHHTTALPLLLALTQPMGAAAQTAPGLAPSQDTFTAQRYENKKPKPKPETEIEAPKPGDLVCYANKFDTLLNGLQSIGNAPKVGAALYKVSETGYTVPGMKPRTNPDLKKSHHPFDPQGTLVALASDPNVSKLNTSSPNYTLNNAFEGTVLNLTPLSSDGLIKNWDNITLTNKDIVFTVDKSNPERMPSGGATVPPPPQFLDALVGGTVPASPITSLTSTPTQESGSGVVVHCLQN